MQERYQARKSMWGYVVIDTLKNREVRTYDSLMSAADAARKLNAGKGN